MDNSRCFQLCNHSFTQAGSGHPQPACMSWYRSKNDVLCTVCMPRCRCVRPVVTVLQMLPPFGQPVTEAACGHPAYLMQCFLYVQDIGCPHGLQCQANASHLKLVPVQTPTAAGTHAEHNSSILYNQLSTVLHCLDQAGNHTRPLCMLKTSKQPRQHLPTAMRLLHSHSRPDCFTT